jgi:GR25 family glycosyltransferase involved in LPS biosynthesis
MPDFTYRQLTLDTYFDKIFYINLKRDTIRNQQIINELSKYNITNYERIDAIELTEIPTNDKFRNFNKTNTKYILGQLSCRASHIKCVQIAKERNYSKVLILEDDIRFLQDPNTLLTINNNILSDWDMLYFGGLVEPFFRNQIVCAHAYGISNKLFDNIIYMGESSGMEIDNYYAKVLQHMSYNNNQSGKYNIRIIQPFNQVVQDKNFISNIQD